MKKSGYLLILLIILSVLALDMHFSSSNLEYSRYNSNWNGTSLFINDAADMGSVFVSDYKQLSGVFNSTLILIEPDQNFSPEELYILRDYESNGNLIFISDETGSSDILMKLFGADLSVKKGELSSVDKEYNNPRFVICYVSAKDPLLFGVQSIALNKPSVASGDYALIKTSFLSWIDENSNKKADATEPLGKRPVLVRSDKIYLLSDSGIFQNAVYKDKNLKDNRIFIINLLESSETVFIEDKHSKIASEENILKIINTVRNNEMIKTATIIIIVLLLLLIYRGKYD
ncbi:MAG: hypothetical protein JXQ82_06665 [Methanomicrobiaceae archaeon]|nr:hypothetical protein [Methanomicrobiaceae archaeon]